MTELIRYEAARRALTEAVMFDEVLSIIDVAEQAALYARQANDNDLVEKATEIRVRAQRKAGEMLTQAKAGGHLADQTTGGKRGAAARHGRSVIPTSQKPTLKDIGVSKEQSSQWQQLASMSEEHFEAAVATAKDTAGQVTTAFMLKAAKSAKPVCKPMRGRRADAMREQLEEARTRGVSMLATYLRLSIKTIRSMTEFTEQERELLAELEGAIQQLRSVSTHEDSIDRGNAKARPPVAGVQHGQPPAATGAR